MCSSDLGVGPGDGRPVPDEDASEVDPRGERGGVAGLRRVDAPEAVLLHGDVPEIEEGRDGQRDGTQAVGRRKRGMEPDGLLRPGRQTLGEDRNGARGRDSTAGRAVVRLPAKALPWCSSTARRRENICLAK